MTHDPQWIDKRVVVMGDSKWTGREGVVVKAEPFMPVRVHIDNGPTMPFSRRELQLLKGGAK